VTNYRNEPQRAATEADWGTTDRQQLHQRWIELPGTATETDRSVRDCHEI